MAQRTLLAILVVIAALASTNGAATSMVAAGLDRSCAVSESGEATCWGDNTSGALGDGVATQRAAAAPVVGLASMATVTTMANAFHTCAIDPAGALFCWGDNGNAQLGNGTFSNSSVPIAVPAFGSGVAAVATGAYHTCALTTEGAVWCWGANVWGQLGNNSTSSQSGPVATLGVGAGVRAITAGFGHTCAVNSGGVVLCWGLNASGQTAGGAAITARPTAVAGVSGASAITAGSDHTCALAAGAVKCWGANATGALGDGTTNNSRTPVNVAGLSDVTRISAGAFHTCALVRSEAVRCWGSNSRGQLGNGTTDPASTPVAVAGLPGAIAEIASGFRHTCALLIGGTATCWGGNDRRQSGSEGADRLLAPTPVTGAPAGLTSISAGEYHTCALSASRSVLCWGGDTYLQLGSGREVGRSYPAPIAALPNAIATIGVGSAHACALASDGQVWCWGENGQGQLGVGEVGATSVALPVALGSRAIALAVGRYHTCALTISDGALCWGQNDAGALGDGTTTSARTPVRVSGLPPNVVKLAAGSAHTCALTADGALWCWGENRLGQLGNGTTTASASPLEILASNVRSVALGALHSCALTVDLTLLCWGDNSADQLGGGGGNATVPRPVAGLTQLSAVAAGDFHTCAIARGSVQCWGSNRMGQLGTGTTFRSTAAPVTVSAALPGVDGISLGRFHSCAKGSNGLVSCWGYNSSGGLGDATFADRSTPTLVVASQASGSLAANDWFLDLDPRVAEVIPADKVPAYQVKTYGNVATAVVDVRTDARFRAQDVGRSIFLYAYSPASLAKRESTAKDEAACVLSQLTSEGLRPVSVASLQASAISVTAAQQQTVSLLSNVVATQIAGSTFCIGTGVTGGQAVDPANSRCVATVPADNVCLPPTAAAVAADIPGALTGLWWNASESGWGIHFTQRRNIVFAAWYTYDASGNPKWYVVPSCGLPSGMTGTSGTCSGSLYEVAGPGFFGVTFNTAQVSAAIAGSLSVNFQNANAASMTYTLGTQTRTVALTRTPVGTGSTPPAVNYTDIWWAPSESGWGMAIAHEFSNMFLAWYVYDGTGKPVWYVVPNCAVSGNACSGGVFRTTGPPFGPTFDPTRVTPFQAGTASVTFTDANNATLGFTVNGVTGAKTITRNSF
jgi:alpha-tubulin suppressor-like RCC1 family protein